MSASTRHQAAWGAFVRAILPFADAADGALPMGRLMRLALFQVSTGMAAVLLTGTLNRVLIVEMGVTGALVSAMVALPLVVAPLRALLGHRSDTHRSVLGWRRMPYIWFGSLAQFGGLAILPFALLILSGDTHGPVIIGHVFAAIAILAIGGGMHTVQTAGLALATDLATEDQRPRVVALLYVMLLAGMLASSLVLGWLLADFSAVRLIQVVQGAALATLALNIVAMWRQEARNPDATRPGEHVMPFSQAWQRLASTPGVRRLLAAVALGSAGFSMQDVLLEPYGADVLGLAVGQTTLLTALWAAGTLVGLALAARALDGRIDAHRLAGYGALAGAVAFACVVISGPLQSPGLFRAGVVLIGFGGGLFSVGTLSAAMALSRGVGAGLALGAWGAVQAVAAGLGILAGGVLRDAGLALVDSGILSPAASVPATAYGFVYHFEIGLLFAAMAVIGPLARHAAPKRDETGQSAGFGLTNFPT